MTDADRAWVACLVGARFVGWLELELESLKGDDYYRAEDRDFMRGYREGLDAARYLRRCSSEGEGAAMSDFIKRLNAGATRPSDGETPHE